jgi:hypothetical protein
VEDAAYARRRKAALDIGSRVTVTAGDNGSLIKLSELGFHRERAAGDTVVMRRDLWGAAPR